MWRSNQTAQNAFIERWINIHNEDSDKVLRKPILITEFGLSSKVPGYTVAKRDKFYAEVFNRIYFSASHMGACAGGAFWQLFVEGMNNMRDGYEVIFEETPSTTHLISQQSFRMSHIR